VNTGLRKAAIILLIVSFGPALFSCALPVKERPVTLPVEEQEKKSMEKFNEMLEMTANVPRHTVVPQIEQGYYDIISNYPDSYLAEEAYFRLIIMNLEDYYPNRIEKAEELYREYFSKYPKPRLNNAINDTMVRYYYIERHWEKLAAMCIPYLKEYAKTGKLSSPLFIFFYSEAKLYMDDLNEARKGYKILISQFPSSHEAKIARDRLNEIQKAK
jgi:TolA-binding protein